MIVVDMHPERVLGAGDTRAVRALILYTKVRMLALYVAIETAPVLDQLAARLALETLLGLCDIFIDECVLDHCRPG